MPFFQKYNKLNLKSTELIDLFYSRIDVLDDLNNDGIKKEVISWLNETRMLIDNNEAVIALDNLLDNLYEFDFLLHLDEMNLLKEIITEFNLETWLGEYYQEVPKLATKGNMDRDNYKTNKNHEMRIQGEVLNFNTLEEVKMKFEAMEWNSRMLSQNTFSTSKNWCELEFKPDGKTFKGLIKTGSIEKLREIFLKFRYRIKIEQKD